MKISYNWLKEYLSINIAPPELAEVLTNTGLEVEGMETFTSVAGGLEGLVIGEVIAKEKHPDADRLSITKVHVGNDTILPIVCGAPNVAEGQKVVVATVGTTLYPNDNEPFKIKKSKIRGQVSEGMICAEDEIGLGESHEGIMVLPDDVPVGTLAAHYFEVSNDIVFEIGLTPNRSDAMSHIGVARDIAAALNAHQTNKLAVKFPSVNVPKITETLPISVTVANHQACPRYAGAVIDNIEVKPSPQWMQNKLKAVGIRPINNIVDITNFILKEYGQPLHAFDYDAIEGHEIIVRKANEGELFVTLDEKERKLSSQDLMICNKTNPMCMAGVFGGLQSGVNQQTKTIFLESAYFDSTSIRISSTTHQLRTDAAQRYEKGADPNIVIPALHRAVALICELANGKIASEVIDVYPTPIENNKISLSLKRLHTLSGVEIAAENVLSILQDLDIVCDHQEIVENDLVFHLYSPPYRADVIREVDVIEEVLRIYGFNNIAIPKQVKSILSFSDGPDKFALKDEVANKLNGLGFYETTTNSISKSKYYNEHQAKNLVQLQNSMTAELDVMRGDLLPDGLSVIAHNINRKNKDLKLFEFGNIYHKDYSQHEYLYLYQTGLFAEGNWVAQASKGNFYYLKGVVTAILNRFGLEQGLTISETNNPNFDYGISINKNKKLLAEIGAVANHQLNAFEIEQEVFCASIDWQQLVIIAQKNKVSFEAIPKFPEVERDVAIIVDETITFNQIEESIRQAGSKLLQDVFLFDVFRDKDKIGANKKSYALKFTLLNREKTLTDKEIDKIFNKIMRTLETEINAVIRK